MYANRTDVEDGSDPAPDVPDEIVTEFAEAARRCLAARASLNPVLTDLRRQHLEGQPVQDRLNALFDRTPALLTVAQIAEECDLDGLADCAVSRDALSEPTAEEFADWWRGARWVAPGVDAHRRQEAGRLDNWTEKALTPRFTERGLVFEHRLAYGVDTVHELTVDPERLFRDAAQRLLAVVRTLGAATERGRLDRETVVDVVESRALLVQTLDEMDELVESASAAEDAADAPDDAAVAGDPLSESLAADDRDDEPERQASQPTGFH